MASRAAVLCIALAAMADAKPWACIDYDNTTSPECFEAVTWAMANGDHVNASWYPNGTTTFADYQCALFLKKGEKGDGPSHGCELPPCTAPSAGMHSEGLDYLRSVKNCSPPKKGLPWWAWALVAVAVISLLIIGALVYMQMTKKKPQKKKRALKPEPKPEPVETKVEPLPTYQTVYTAAPVYTYAAQPPMVAAAPVSTYAAAAPITTYAAPAPVMTAAPVSSMSLAMPAYTTPSQIVYQQ